jgi:hypothetical protein
LLTAYFPQRYSRNGEQVGLSLLDYRPSQDQRERAGRANAKDAVARWHHVTRDVAVGVCATASGVGAKKRVFNLNLTHGPHCGGQLRIVAAILQR